MVNKQKQYIRPFYGLLFLGLLPSAYTNSIVSTVGSIFSDDNLDEKTAEKFLNFLLDITNSYIHYVICPELSKGLEIAVGKFIENRKFCLNVLDLLIEYKYYDECKIRTQELYPTMPSLSFFR